MTAEPMTVEAKLTEITTLAHDPYHTSREIIISILDIVEAPTAPTPKHHKSDPEPNSWTSRLHPVYGPC